MEEAIKAPNRYRLGFPSSDAELILDAIAR